LQIVDRRLLIEEPRAPQPNFQDTNFHPYGNIYKLKEAAMAVKIVLRQQEFEVGPGQTVRQAMLSLQLPPEAYLAVRAGELITEDEILREGETIKLVAVISGG
jgi:sulfur carrier protein ThiS